MDSLRNNFLIAKPQNKLAWALAVHGPTAKSLRQIKGVNFPELCRDIKEFILRSPSRKLIILFSYNLTKGAALIYHRQITIFEGDVFNFFRNYVSVIDINKHGLSLGEDEVPKKKRRVNIENIDEVGGENITMEDVKRASARLPTIPDAFVLSSREDHSESFYDDGVDPANEIDILEPGAFSHLIAAPPTQQAVQIPTIMVSENAANQDVDQQPISEVQFAPIYPEIRIQPIETPQPVVTKKKKGRVDVTKLSNEELIKLFTVKNIRPRRGPDHFVDLENMYPKEAPKLVPVPQNIPINLQEWEDDPVEEPIVSEPKRRSELGQILAEISEVILNATSQQRTKSGTGLHVGTIEENQGVSQVSPLPTPATSGILIEPSAPERSLEGQFSVIGSKSDMSLSEPDETLDLETTKHYILSILKLNDGFVPIKDLIDPPSNRLKFVKMFNVLLKLREDWIIEIIKEPGSIKIMGVKRGPNFNYDLNY